MRRMIFGGLLAASLVLPGVALAKQAPMPAINGNATQLQRSSPLRTTSQAAIGGGMQVGNEPGHTAGPGGAKVDNDARGPVNDVQVGRGTDDTPQSKNPPPER